MAIVDFCRVYPGFIVSIGELHALKHLKLKFGVRWLNTVLAVSEYMSFGKSLQEKGCGSQAETWQVKNVLMKDFD